MKMTENNETPPPRPKKKKSGLFWLIFIGLGFALPGASFILLTGMIPTWVMYIVERRKPRYLTFCVGAFNFTGTLPYFLLMCQGNHSVKHALEILGAPTPWLVMYGTSSIGLALFSVVPSAVKFIRQMQMLARIDFAEKQRSQILKEWGDQIKEIKEKH